MSTIRFTTNHLKRIRTKRGLSQLDLAKLCDITPSDISKIENDRIYPHPGWRQRLSDALNLPEDRIFPEEKRLADALNLPEQDIFPEEKYQIICAEREKR